MPRILIPLSALLLTAACTQSEAGKTVVYALSEVPVGQLDPATCAQGVGLQLELGFEDSIGYTVDIFGDTALLTACDLTDTGEVAQCGILQPETELALDGDVITGSSVARLEIEGDCEGADIALDYSMVVDGSMLRTEASATWQLDDTLACEQLESAVIQGSASGAGVNGCVVSYTFDAERLAVCDFSRGTPCRYGE